MLVAGPAPALTIHTIGAPGAPGADGEAAVATAASSDAENYALAEGGEGGASPSDGIAAGDGGSAQASAQTTAVGPTRTDAIALAGAGGAGSALTAGGAGGDSVADAIGESGAGAASVWGTAWGGDGVDGGAGGAARSSADGRNAGSEKVQVVVESRGGRGGAANFEHPASTGGRGGDAELGPVYGASSGGGEVAVFAEANGGEGGSGIPTSDQAAGDGASVLLENAVDGDTSGSLYLAQVARGGRAGSFGGGVHGETSSSLEVDKSLQSLEITSLADGAFDASSRAIAVNHGGSVTVHGEAVGGDGRFAYQEVGEGGGGARSYSFARSFGDGHAVVVAPTNPTGLNAHGGAGRDATSLTNAGGGGGYAISASEGYAIGDSPVTVVDRAKAGDGGFGNGAAGEPGVGGGAFSLANAVGGVDPGVSPVHASSWASGGQGGRFDDFVAIGPGARGGEARAESNAVGTAEVGSLATAIAGLPGVSFDPAIVTPSGRAQARASALGASGEARAIASASDLIADASASVPSSARVESQAALANSFFRNPLRDFDAFAVIAGRPDATEVEAATQGSAQVADAIATGAFEIVLALGQVGFTRMQDAEGALMTQRAALSLTPYAREADGLQQVTVGFLNPESLGSGFDSLRLRANLGLETVLDVSFDELNDALAYFDDRVLDLGDSPDPCFESPGFGRRDFCFFTPLELIFDWTGSEAGAGFGVDVIVGVTPVPEPSTALLFAIGLAVMAARARQRRGAAI
jgi:hypothetical protein